MRNISYDITFVVQFLTFYIVEPKKTFFKWQYRAGAVAGAGAEIKGKVEPEIILAP